MKISHCDRKILKAFHWWVHKSSGYLVRKHNGKMIAFHREVLDAQPGEEVDHINRNRLDNRRSNLRIVPRSVNNINKGLQRNNKSVFNGIHWHKKNSRWTVGMMKPRIYMGSYIMKSDAIYVYDCWHKFIFGEFSRKRLRG